MAVTRIHRILEEVGVAGLPRCLRHAFGEDRQRAGFPMAFVSGYSVAATAIGEPDMGLLDPDRDDRPGAADLHERDDPDHRRCRHRLRQPAERPPHGRRADRRRGRGLLPGGPGLAEEVRAHARQAGDRPTTTTSRRSAPRSTPGATATSSSSPGPTRWPSSGLDEAIARVEAAREAGADASFVEAPASRRGSRGDRPALAGPERGQHDRGGQDARSCRARSSPPWDSS